MCSPWYLSSTFWSPSLGSVTVPPQPFRLKYTPYMGYTFCFMARNNHNMTLASEISMFTKKFGLHEGLEARWIMPNNADCILASFMHVHPAGNVALYRLDVLCPAIAYSEQPREGNRYKFNMSGQFINMLGIELNVMTQQCEIGTDPEPDLFGSPATMLAHYLREGVNIHDIVTIK